MSRCKRSISLVILCSKTNNSKLKTDTLCILNVPLVKKRCAVKVHVLFLAAVTTTLMELNRMLLMIRSREQQFNFSRQQKPANPKTCVRLWPSAKNCGPKNLCATCPVS